MFGMLEVELPSYNNIRTVLPHVKVVANIRRDGRFKVTFKFSVNFYADYH